MNEAQDIIEHDQPETMPAPRQQTQIAQAPTPAHMLATAVEQGADLEKLEKLMALQERWEANEARKAFDAAMSAFKADPPVLFKNRHVKFKTRDGDVTEYDHASLDHITTECGKKMAPHGLGFRWDIEQLEGGRVRVTCIVTHAQGHSIKVPLEGSPDQSGKKNAIQQTGSTITYLQRYTLLSAVGLAAKGQDDDGRGAGRQIETISAEQVADLESLISEVGANRENFLKASKIERLEDMPAEKYQGAVRRLEQRRKQTQESTK